MRRILTLIVLLLFSCLAAEQLTDGPYFRLEQQGVLLQYLWQDEVISQSYAWPENGELRVEIADLDGSYQIYQQAPEIAADEYNQVEKIFAISDIHGQYNRFVEILTSQQVIDAEQNWTFSSGHLVIVGDVFDRGEQVTEALWLIKKLSDQAEKQAGKVHYLLGNHEVAVLLGDDRYVNNKYLQVAEKLQVDHAELYSNATVLGRWIRSRNACVKINDILFVHGGISPQLLKRGYRPPALNAKVREIFADSASQPKDSEEKEFILGSFGPFWYRGYLTSGSKYRQLRQTEAEQVLAELKISNLVVGHTTQSFINPFFGSRIIPIDAGIKYADQGEGLLWQAGKFYRALADGYREELD
ncbi:MAG: metallophosphoesterase [Candidatus Cloacimonadales bacterium]